MTAFFARSLSYHDGEETQTIGHEELLTWTGSYVILGEPGIGKSELAQWVSEQTGDRHITAKRLLRLSNPQEFLAGTGTVIIDALDEVPDGSADQSINALIPMLQESKVQRFVLTCRAVDWRSATAGALVEEGGSSPLTEFRLLPLTEADAQAHLMDALGAARARETITHFQHMDVTDILGNPQTLKLVALVAKKAALPASRRELYRDACDILVDEQNEVRREMQSALSIGEAKETAGAVMAALLLTVSEAVTLYGKGDVYTVAVPSIARLPEANEVKKVLDTKLFRLAGEKNRLTYTHRTIAEFLAASYLSARAKSAQHRRSMLASFQASPCVPTHLRGLHAWLSLDVNLAEQVIQRDPVGVVENADVGVLTHSARTMLLRELERVHTEQPDLRLRPKRLAAALLPDLVREIKHHLRHDGDQRGLQPLLLDALGNRPCVPELVADLESLALLPGRHHRAAEATLSLLHRWGQQTSVRRVFATWAKGGNDDLKLAAEMARELGVHDITDFDLARVVINSKARGPDSFNFVRLIGVISEERALCLLEGLAFVLSQQATKPAWHNDSRGDLVRFLVVTALQGMTTVPGTVTRFIAHAGAPLVMRLMSDPTFSQAVQHDADLRVLHDQYAEELLDSESYILKPGQPFDDNLRRRQITIKPSSQGELVHSKAMAKKAKTGTATAVNWSSAVREYLIELASPPATSATWLEKRHGKAAGLALRGRIRSCATHFHSGISITDVVRSVTEGEYLTALSATAAVLQDAGDNGENLRAFADAPIKLALAVVLAWKSGRDASSGVMTLLREVDRRGLELAFHTEFIQAQFDMSVQEPAGLTFFTYGKCASKGQGGNVIEAWLEGNPLMDPVTRKHLEKGLLQRRHFSFLCDYSGSALPHADAETNDWLRAVSLVCSVELGRDVPAAAFDVADLTALRDVLRSVGFENLGLANCLGYASMFYKAREDRVKRGPGSGEPDPWRDSRFVASLINMLMHQRGQQASAELRRLMLQTPRDQHTNRLMMAFAEHNQVESDAAYRPMTMDDIGSMLREEAPQSIESLRHRVLEELAIVRRRILSDELESWRGLYAGHALKVGDSPLHETACRNHLLGMLRQTDQSVRYDPEGAVSGDRAADITCSLQQWRLPIEVKGQWHAQLWTAADQQLDQYYGTDWRAEGLGIYLVLRFPSITSGTKAMKAPPNGEALPESAEDLEALLTKYSQAALSHRVRIVVIDVPGIQVKALGGRKKTS